MKIDIGPYPKNSKTKRKIKVKIHGYDLWNLNHTLALVILAALKAYKKVPHSYGFVKDEDVPAKLRNGDKDYCKKKWNYIIGEMVWAFEQEVNEEDYLHLSDTKWMERQRNGLILFAKYYGGLWT